MNDVACALVVSSLLSVLLATIQISIDAKTNDLRSIITSSFIFYILIMVIGNIITTLLSANLIDNNLPAPGSSQTSFLLIGPRWIWYSIFGVFGFEAIIQKVNVTFFDQGVLTIHDWLTKAKKSATAASLEKIVMLNFQDSQSLASKLKDQLDQESIHTFASMQLGFDQYEKIIDSIKGNDKINHEEYLAYVLAEQSPRVVKAKIRAR
ncbi:hypothetical protein LVD15_14510 [Fulvivirga maritima]|uniref:hypothetical protein n=1 Tax=Fulvivirga maritima TaxID=2904247 RepID=UPI001F38D3DE|nr:hypothetical protein [Fulvivirga maritima]UII24535.1 hypothetical protein LVD15_14510 [Fulvivirga maritima]